MYVCSPMSFFLKQVFPWVHYFSPSGYDDDGVIIVEKVGLVIIYATSNSNK